MIQVNVAPAPGLYAAGIDGRIWHVHPTARHAPRAPWQTRRIESRMTTLGDLLPAAVTGEEEEVTGGAIAAIQPPEPVKSVNLAAPPDPIRLASLSNTLTRG